MRGRLASRAQSFKESILNALGNHHQQNSNQQQEQRQEQQGQGQARGGQACGGNGHPSNFDGLRGSAGAVQGKTPRTSASSANRSLDPLPVPLNRITAAKKTSSSDNLIDSVTSGTEVDPRSTEAMVREVNLALCYFEVGYDLRNDPYQVP